MTLSQCELHFKFIQDNPTLFKGGHDRFTPLVISRDLCRWIKFGKHPILVLFTIEFVLDLVYTYGIDVQRIVFYADHENKVELAKHLGVKYYTDLGKIKMKSRPILLTNPPYTDGLAGDNEIYTSLLKNCIEKFDPILICGVTPENLINGGQKKRELRELLLKKYGFSYVKFLNQKIDWDSNISVDTIAWVAEEGYVGPTTVVGRNSGDSYMVDMKKEKLTELVNGESQDLHDWLISIQTTEKLKLKTSKKTPKKGTQAKISKDSPKDSLVLEKGYEFESDNTNWRVAFGYMRCNTCALVPPGVSIPSKYRYITFKNKSGAVKFRKYMLSEAVRFILQSTYTSRTLDNPQLSYVPVIDLSNIKTITDESVYDFLKTKIKVRSIISKMIGDKVPF